MSDVQFSGAEVLLITGLLAAVTAPLTYLFRLLLAEKDRQIVRLEAQNDRLLDMNLSGTKAVESATTALRDQRGSVR